MQEYPFRFSVISAVYNVAPYLDEMILSIISQDIGFREHVQLILVDDGSTDGSGEICDKYAALYPENILALHQENRGVSATRNLGLSRATGKYYNFCDPDDLLSDNTLSLVWDFFEAHEAETDVVTIPMYFFEAYTGVPYHHCKFAKGTRVIDLQAEPYAPLLSSSSSFIHARRRGDFCFDEGLTVSEDAKYVQHILFDKQTLGVVAECKYLYRRRLSGTSAINASQKSDSWYFDSPTRFILETFFDAKKTLGYIPAFLQHTVLCDLKWRLIQKPEENKYYKTDPERFRAYRDLLLRCFEQIDPETVIANPFYDDVLTFYVLYHIRKIPPELIRQHNRVGFAYGTFFLDLAKVCALEGTLFEQDPVSGRVTLTLSMTALPAFQEFDIFMNINGTRVPLSPISEEEPRLLLGMETCRRMRYEISVLPEGKRTFVSVQIQDPQTGLIIDVPCDLFSKVFPLNTLKHSFFRTGKYIFKKSDRDVLVFRRCRNPFKRIGYELLYDRDLRRVKRPNGYKMIGIRWYYRLYKFFFRRQRFLISDRIGAAGDNGEAFFRYLHESKEKRARYLFAVGDDREYERLSRAYGHTVRFATRKFYRAYLLADVILSSHPDDFIARPLGEKQVYMKDIAVRKQFIFLQHGVTQNDISPYLDRYKRDLSAIVTAAKSEAENFRRPAYHYRPEMIWQTGFPRFDYLYRDEKKIVTVMPTWRSFLADRIDPQTGEWTLLPGFTESAYYLFFNRLLNDGELISALASYGYRLAFMPHPIVKPHVSLFDKREDVIFFDAAKPYREVFAESDLLITDYSSAVYDFAYLGKPILYAQFDREDMKTHPAAYRFDEKFYDDNAFGEICFDYEALKAALLSYVENGCAVKPAYAEKQAAFFLHCDKESCRRIREKIASLPKPNA